MHLPQHLINDIKKYARGFVLDSIADYQEDVTNLDSEDANDSFYPFMEKEAERILELSDVKEYLALVCNSYGEANVKTVFCSEFVSAASSIRLVVLAG